MSYYANGHFEMHVFSRKTNYYIQAEETLVYKSNLDRKKQIRCLGLT